MHSSMRLFRAPRLIDLAISIDLRGKYKRGTRHWDLFQINKAPHYFPKLEDLRDLLEKYVSHRSKWLGFLEPEADPEPTDSKDWSEFR